MSGAEVWGPDLYIWLFCLRHALTLAVHSVNDCDESERLMGLGGWSAEWAGSGFRFATY